MTLTSTLSEVFVHSLSPSFISIPLSFYLWGREDNSDVKTYFTIKAVRLIKQRPEAMERSDTHKPNASQMKYCS